MGMAKKRVHRPEGSRPISPQSARPATPRPSATQPARRDLRERFEDASRPLLQRMQALPNFIVPVLLGVMLFFGLTLDAAWAGGLLLVIALFLSWLTAISWPAISPGSRILRVVVDLGILGLGVLKLMGRL